MAAPTCIQLCKAIQATDPDFGYGGTPFGYEDTCNIVRLHALGLAEPREKARGGLEGLYAIVRASWESRIAGILGQEPEGVPTHLSQQEE